MAHSSRSLLEIQRIWCEPPDDIDDLPMTPRDPNLSSERTCDDGESDKVHRQLCGTQQEDASHTSHGSALSEQLVKAMEKIRETNRDLYEELMAIEDPCTTAVLFIQLCVKAARGMHHPMAERRREKIGAELTEAEKWRLEQLSLQFTTHEQKVQVVKILLQAESKFASLDQAENFGLRFPRFWSFMSKYHISDTAVRFRKFLSPRESRRKRVMSMTSRQSSTLWM